MKNDLLKLPIPARELSTRRIRLDAVLGGHVFDGTGTIFVEGEQGDYARAIKVNMNVGTQPGIGPASIYLTQRLASMIRPAHVADDVDFVCSEDENNIITLPFPRDELDGKTVSIRIFTVFAGSAVSEFVKYAGTLTTSYSKEDPTRGTLSAHSMPLAGGAKIVGINTHFNRALLRFFRRAPEGSAFDFECHDPQTDGRA